jgi:FkbM family methyltransferase
MMKRFLKSVADRLGLEIRRVRRQDPNPVVLNFSSEFGRDAWNDLQRLTATDSPVIFDVGANVGQSVELFRERFPRPTIHAFEPGEFAFDKLVSATRGLSGVLVRNVAVGSKPGSVTLVENTDWVMSSVYEPSGDCWGEVRVRRTVDVVTLDGYCRDRGIDRIDVLKTDTQGHDLEVLRGAEGLIARRAVRLVLTELIFSDLYKEMPRFDALIGHLLDRGFALVAVYDFGFQHDRAAWCDALFVHPEFVASAGGA